MSLFGVVNYQLFVLAENMVTVIQSLKYLQFNLSAEMEKDMSKMLGQIAELERKNHELTLQLRSVESSKNSPNSNNNNNNNNFSNGCNIFFQNLNIYEVGYLDST